MDTRTKKVSLTNHVIGLMARLESHHKCCFNEINSTFADIERLVVRASDAGNMGKLLFYSNLIAKAVDAVGMGHE